ncbi:MAG: cation transporter [Actinomycetota bacterium]
MALILALIAAKLAAAATTGSLALLSEAANSILDAGTAHLTLLAIRISTRCPWPCKSPHWWRLVQGIRATPR